jgi:hypothetical protein
VVVTRRTPPLCERAFHKPMRQSTSARQTKAAKGLSRSTEVLLRTLTVRLKFRAGNSLYENPDDSSGEVYHAAIKFQQKAFYSFNRERQVNLWRQIPSRIKDIENFLTKLKTDCINFQDEKEQNGCYFVWYGQSN